MGASSIVNQNDIGIVGGKGVQPQADAGLPRRATRHDGTMIKSCQCHLDRRGFTNRLQHIREIQ